MSDSVNSLRATLRGTRLPGLDGLRAVAVLVVIGYHFGFPAPAGLGVTLFFVLSGFLITWLLRREWQRTDDVSLSGFYLRRTLRIFPAYYVFVAFSFSVLALRGLPWTGGLLASTMTYTTNYYNAFQGHKGAFSHLWSLAVEEQFYFLWPLTFLAVMRRGGERRLASAVAVALGVILVWRCYLLLVAQVGMGYVYNAFDTRVDSILMGCLMALSIERDWFGRVTSVVAARSWFPLVTLALLMTSQQGGDAWAKGPGFSVDSVLLSVFVIQVLVHCQRPLWRWLEHPVARYIGLLSYPMYLYHQWGLGLAHRARTLPEPVQFLIGVAVTMAFAAGSYYVIERPCLALKARLEPRLRARQAARAARAADARAAAA